MYGLSNSRDFSGQLTTCWLVSVRGKGKILKSSISTPGTVTPSHWNFVQSSKIFCEGPLRQTEYSVIIHKGPILKLWNSRVILNKSDSIYRLYRQKALNLVLQNKCLDILQIDLMHNYLMQRSLLLTNKLIIYNPPPKKKHIQKCPNRISLMIRLLYYILCSN